MKWNRKYVHFLGSALEALPEEKKHLGTLFLLSAGGHVLVFFLLHISYPVSIPFHVTHTQITLFSPQLVTDGTWREKETWYEMNDPSRLIRLSPGWLGDSPLDVKLLQVPEPTWAPVMLPVTDEPGFQPVGLDPLAKRVLASPPSRQIFRYEIPDESAVASSTVADWEEPLRTRWTGDPWKLPSVSSDRSTLNETHVTILRLAVNARGEVEHVLLDSSCGNRDPNIDLMAVDAARTLHFLPAPQSPLEWGRVSIFWKFVSSTPLPPKAGSGVTP